MPTASTEEYSYMFAHGTRFTARPSVVRLPRWTSAPPAARTVATRPTRSPAVVLMGMPVTDTFVNAKRKK